MIEDDLRRTAAEARAAGRDTVADQIAAVIETARKVAGWLVERETLDWRPDRVPPREDAMALAVAVDKLDRATEEHPGPSEPQ